MKRIGFLIGNPLNNGGAERVICNLANQSLKNGYKVYVICSEQCDNGYFLSDGIIQFFYDDHLKNCPYRLLRIIKRFFYIRNICKAEKIDALITFLIPAYGFLATRGLKTKCILSERNDPRNKCKGFFSSLIKKISFAFADSVAFQTEEARDWYPKCVIPKSKIIFNPVKDVFFKTPYNPIENNIITCGRLNKQKNQRLLLDAMLLVHDKCPELKLTVFGEGELRAQLESFVRDNQMENYVFLPGNKQNIQDELAKAEIFVLTSDFEGAPNALMEAMTVGVPSISTDCPCGGPKMLLGDNQRGILLSDAHKLTLANAIINLHHSNELKINFSKESKQFSLKFQSNLIFKEWENIINI